MVTRILFVVAALVIASGAATAATLEQLGEGGTLNGVAAADLETKPPATELGVGDTVVGPARIKAADGSVLSLSAGATISVQAPGDGEEIELFFLKLGILRGQLKSATEVALPLGWLKAVGEEAAIYAESIDKERAFLQAVGGDVAFYRQDVPEDESRVTVAYIPENHGIEVWMERAEVGGEPHLGIATEPGNASAVRIISSVSPTLEVELYIPKATYATIGQEQNRRYTRVASKPESLVGATVRVETKVLEGENKTGTVKPGAFVLIDNVTGEIRQEFIAIDFAIIERAISLTSEFSTLAGSNYSTLAEGED